MPVRLGSDGIGLPDDPIRAVGDAGPYTFFNTMPVRLGRYNFMP